MLLKSLVTVLGLGVALTQSPTTLAVSSSPSWTPSWTPSTIVIDVVTPASPTATILGSVAVGVLGISLLVGVIIYFRKGGTVGGLLKKFEENKDTIKQVAGSVAELLPLSKEQKDKIDATIDSPVSILPPEVQQVAEQVAEKVVEYKDQIIDALPVSDEQKVEITVHVKSVTDAV